MNKNAFTLIELLIVIAIAVIITGALVPLFSVTKQDAKFARAMSELEAVRTAATSLHYDTGEWPHFPFPALDLSDNSNRNLADWQGPYLEYIPNDPWGEPYLWYLSIDSKLYICTKGQDKVHQEDTDPKIIINPNHL